MGFFADAPAWACSTGNLVRNISYEKGIVWVTIKKGEGVFAAGGGNDKTIITFSGDLDKTIATFIISKGALAMRRKLIPYILYPRS